MIEAQVIEGDDFYRVMSETQRGALQPEEAYMRYFDWPRLRTQELEPLRKGKAARYEQYDWDLQRLGPAVQVEPKGLIIVEGSILFDLNSNRFTISLFTLTLHIRCASRE